MWRKGTEREGKITVTKLNSKTMNCKKTIETRSNGMMSYKSIDSNGNDNDGGGNGILYANKKGI